MKAYLLSLVTVAMCGAIFSCLAPRGTGDGISKQINLILSLVLVAFLVRPVVDFVKGISDFDSESAAESIMSGVSDDNYSQVCSQVWQKTISCVSAVRAKQIICEEISADFELSDNDFEVEPQITVLSESISLDGISVTLYGKGLFVNPRVMENKLCEKFGCECTVN